MADILQLAFSGAFPWTKYFRLAQIALVCFSKGSINYGNVDLYNYLARNNRQAIIEAGDGAVYWYMYASFDFEELTRCAFGFTFTVGDWMTRIFSTMKRHFFEKGNHLFPVRINSIDYAWTIMSTKKEIETW